jgi:hypothetical protein
MTVPSPCGKLQSRRGLGAKASGLPGAAARRSAQPRAGLATMLCLCAAGLPATAQESARVPHGLLVTSALERIADEHIVSVRFTNSTEQVLDSIRITSSVPPDLRYVARSASGPGSDVLFSADDGRTFGLPEELTLATPDGGVRGADAADYTHVRWVLRAPLDAGATGIARFRAVPR